jgi:hypothetical protein
MRNIAAVHGMRQVNALAGLFVLRWLHLNSEDNTTPTVREGQGACRALGFPPLLQSGLQKSLSCLGCLSCLGIPPSLTVGAPKERVVSKPRFRPTGAHDFKD